MNEDVKVYRKLKKDVRAHVKLNYGKRCKTFLMSCPTCMAWNSFDYLFDNVIIWSEKK